MNCEGCSAHCPNAHAITVAGEKIGICKGDHLDEQGHVTSPDGRLNRAIRDEQRTYLLTALEYQGYVNRGANVKSPPSVPIHVPPPSVLAASFGT